MSENEKGKSGPGRKRGFCRRRVALLYWAACRSGVGTWWIRQRVVLREVASGHVARDLRPVGTGLVSHLSHAKECLQ